MINDNTRVPDLTNGKHNNNRIKTHKIRTSAKESSGCNTEYSALEFTKYMMYPLRDFLGLPSSFLFRLSLRSGVAGSPAPCKEE